MPVIATGPTCSVTWAPSAADVAGLLPQRTDGGVFDDTTTPTATQVAAVACQIAKEVVSEVGTVPAALEETASWVATLGAASYVELSFYPDQNTGGSGPSEQLYDRYQKALEKLRATVADVNSGGTIGGADDVPLPVYGYPTATAGAPITGWSTRF